MNLNIEKHNIVLCEGKEDITVLQKIAEAANIKNLIFQDYKGRSNLKDFLLAKTNSSEFTSGAINRILITRDADDSWENTFTSVKNILKEMLNVEIPSCGKWTKTPTGLKIAVWIAPGFGKKGMIETLCLEAARQDLPDTFSCLDAFANCIQDTQKCELHEKERFAIWSIAVQNKCTPRQRLSIPRGINTLPINWNNDVFNEIKGLLKETAGDAH